MTEQVSGPQGTKIAGRHMVMAPYRVGWWGGGVVAYKTLLSAPIPIWIGIWGLGLGLDNDLDRGTGFSYVGQQQNNKAQQS